MNIALALVSREAGGAEFQACLLADGLRSRGHAVTLYCTHPEESVPMLRQFPDFQTRILRRPCARVRVLNSLTAVAQVRAWLHRDRIDVAVGFLGMPHAVLTYAALGTRVRIYGRRSAVWSECNGYGTYDAHVPQLQRWVQRWGWRTTALVGNSDAVLRSAYDVEGWRTGSVRVIRNGWPECPAIDYRSTLPVYVARPRPEKRVDLATQMFARAGLPLELCFEVPRWEDVGILVHASRADALSNSVGMAMAHGIPVVAFDLPGNRELLGADRCIRRWQYEAMVEDVARLQTNRAWRRGYGTNLQERVRALFSLTTMVDQWEALLTGGPHDRHPD